MQEKDRTKERLEKELADAKEIIAKLERSLSMERLAAEALEETKFSRWTEVERHEIKP